MQKRKHLLEIEFCKLLKKKNLKEGDVTSYLRNNILDLDAILPSGYNCLHMAIKTEDANIVNILLQNNESETGTLLANPNICTND